MMPIQRRDRNLLDLRVGSWLTAHTKQRGCFDKGLLVPSFCQVLKGLKVLIGDLLGRERLTVFLQSVYGIESPNVCGELMPIRRWC